MEHIYTDDRDKPFRLFKKRQEEDIDYVNQMLAEAAQEIELDKHLEKLDADMWANARKEIK